MLFPTYAKLAGFDASKVKWVNVTPDQFPGALVRQMISEIHGKIRQIDFRPGEEMRRQHRQQGSNR
jgi:hypothetical protein